MKLMFNIDKELQSNTRVSAMLGAINNASLHHESWGEKLKNIVSQFSFVIGDEKCSHKYMCFDPKSFWLIRFLWLNFLKKFYEQECHMMAAQLESITRKLTWKPIFASPLIYICACV